MPVSTPTTSTRHWSNSFEDIFQCVHSHSAEIFNSPEVNILQYTYTTNIDSDAFGFFLTNSAFYECLNENKIAEMA